MPEDFKALQKKLHKEIPHESRALSLKSLAAYVKYMESDAVAKDAYGNVKDFRLNSKQAKELAGKVHAEHSSFYVSKLTKGKMKAGDLDSDLVEAAVHDATGHSLESLTEQFKNHEVDSNFYMQNVAAHVEQSFSQHRLKRHVQRLDQLVQDADPDLQKHLKEGFQKYGIEIDPGKIKKGHDVYRHLIELESGIGDAAEHMKKYPEYMKKYVPKDK